MKIYLTRHGETIWNKKGRIQGHKNSSLTDKGIQQAGKLGNRLKNSKIKMIYSSDLKRAYDTGKIISDIIKAPIKIDDRLRELDMGDWCGLLKEELVKDPDVNFEMWLREPENYNIPNGETLQERFNLIKNFFDEIDMNNSGDILIISHGITVKLAILYLINAPITLYKNMSMKNVALNLVEIRDYNPVLTLFNDTCHLVR